jgi:hypothetical protein
MPRLTLALPDFAIIGANKAGTTSVARYLEQNPAVGFASVKEPMFFSSQAGQASAPRGAASLARPYLAVTLPEYAALFPKDRPEARVFGEASTAYMAVPELSARMMCKIVPSMRIIVILREPADRAASAYRMCRGKDIEPRPFGQIVANADKYATVLGNHNVREYIRLGLYSQLLEPFLRFFGPDRRLILRYDDLVRDPERFMSEINAFLGLPKFAYDTARRYNTAEDNDAGDIVIAPEEIARLRAFYAPDIARTQEMTGLDLSDWLR